VLFRSLRSLVRRVAVAGAASALALTVFNAVQPTLGARRVHPGTVKDVAVTLTPAPAVDNREHAPSGSATLPHRGAAPGAGSLKAAPPVSAPLVSAPVPVGKARFVGFSWPAPTAARTVWLRARTAAGWSAWREVEPAADGPDATSPEYRPGRVYSDGHWLDAGTVELQLRVDPPASPATAPATAGAPGPEGGAPGATAGAPGATAGAPGAGAAGPAAGLQAHLITPDLTPTPGTEPPRAGVATAMTTRPAIVSRAGWGADESLRRAAPDYGDTVKAAFVHHTVQSNSYSPSESAALVRADYLYHVRSRGWNDVGYNFLVDRFGRVFEGRYGGITRPVIGAHAGGFNTNTTGVAMLGTFSASRPPSAMLGALQRLLAWKLDLTHVDPLGKTILVSGGGANVRYPPGRKVYTSTILGHRATSYTDCPGSPTIALLRSIRATVAKIGRPKIYRGTVSTWRFRPEAGGSAGVYARFNPVVRWRVSITGSNGLTVRAFTGVGSEARVRWWGWTAWGTLAPPGWATVTVTADAGGAWARPVTSRVFVDRTALPAGTSTGGFSAGAWSVNNANAEQLSSSAPVFHRFRWGRSGDIPVVGDWDGDGTQSVGVVRPDGLGGNRFILRNSNGSVLNFQYGRYGDRVLVGDWDGDGDWTPATVRNGIWSLRNANSAGPADVTVQFGRAGHRYLAGDWDGDGDFTPGAWWAGGFWFRNSPGTGGAELSVRFGRADDLAFVGDWDGNGTWTPGVLRAGTRWYLKNSFVGPTAAVGLAKQTPGTPVVGDWDNRP
jgi:hypothetical protein